MPIGLRHYGYAVALGLNYTTNHRRCKRRMIYVSIAREENYIQFVPAAGNNFFLCCWKKFHHASISFNSDCKYTTLFSNCNIFTWHILTKHMCISTNKAETVAAF